MITATYDETGKEIQINVGIQYIGSVRFDVLEICENGVPDLMMLCLSRKGEMLPFSYLHVNRLTIQPAEFSYIPADPKEGFVRTCPEMFYYPDREEK